MADTLLILEQLPALRELSLAANNKQYRKLLSQASEDLVRAYLEVVHNLVENNTLSGLLTSRDQQFVRRRFAKLRLLSRNKVPLKTQRKRLSELGLTFIKRILPVIERYLDVSVA